MIKKLGFFFLPLLMILVFISCEKEYSAENETGSTYGTSTFTFGGAPSSCTGVVLNGTYTAGVAMDNTNTIEITVNVTKVGTYIVSTPTFNGVSFFASGTFTTTGSQKIILEGDGTPIVAKTYNYPVGSNGCILSVSFEKLILEPPVAVFSFTGSPGNCTDLVVNGSYKINTPLDATNNIVIKVNVITPGTYTIVTNTENGFSFSTIGLFTTTGPQTVTLTGTGTPVTIGPILFTPVSNGCAFVVNCFS